MESYENVKFSLIAHSLGSLVTYKALSSPDFPVKTLSNIYSLAGPLAEEAQMFGRGMGIEELAAKVPDLGDTVAHYDFHGGAKDLLVTASAARFGGIKEKSSCPDCFFSMETVKMKNVYTSISHNWLYFDHSFLNQLVPFIIAQTKLQGKSGPERVENAKQML